MKILLVEDDLDLGNGIRIALSNQRMNVVWLRQLSAATRYLEANLCDLALLDLGLPDGDGLTLLNVLQHKYQELPVIILSARDSLNDRIRGLDSGADDYLVKPFELSELLSRMRALVRRSYRFDGETLCVGELQLSLSTHRVSVQDKSLYLTASEYALLKTMLVRLNRIITRRQLEEQVLSGNSFSSNSLDVHIANLRRKIGDGYIRTVRGIGYIIDQQKS